MKNTYICKKCGKQFVCYHNGKYCSRDCYWNSRWSKNKTCKTCGKKLITGQYRYCSRECMKKYWDKNDYHLNKKKRMRDRKIEIMKLLGGKCVKCGNTDFRVLDINHKDKNKKKRPPKLHYTMSNRLREWSKNISNLELLCANCHRIHTWKQMRYGK